MPNIAYFTGFAGGINQSLSARDIAVNELVDSVNMELNRRRGLRKRPGTSLIKSSTQPFGTDDVTSIYHFEQAGGSETVLYTAAGNAWRRAPEAFNTATAYTAIDAAVTLGAAADWQWVTFDDVVIGVNGLDDTTFDNPVVLQSPTSSLVTMANDAVAWTNIPAWTNPSSIEVWNRRVWIADQDYVYGSKLGDRSDWSTAATGVAYHVGQDMAGGHITAIKRFLGRLFIFFETAIYQIIPAANPVDETAYYLSALTHKVGCIDKNTIQYVGNDLVFLSYEGLTSLRSTDEFGDVQHSILSLNIPAIAETDKGTTKFASVVHPTRQQYWLSLSQSGGDNDNVWVMDYAYIDQGQLPWMRFDGGVVGRSYGLVYYNGEPQVYIGGYNGYAYGYDENKYGDVQVTASPAYAKTKAFDMGTHLLRSEFYRTGAQFELLTDTLSIDLTWTLDEDFNRQKTVGTAYDAYVSASKLGPNGQENLLWDSPPTTGSFYLAGDELGTLSFLTGIRGTAGRRAQTIQITVTLPNDDESAELRALRLDYDILHTNRAVQNRPYSQQTQTPSDARTTVDGDTRTTVDGDTRTVF